VPSPSWPWALLPQLQTVPSERKAMKCALPAERSTTLSSALFREGVFWPVLPQDQTVPSDRSAREA